MGAWLDETPTVRAVQILETVAPSDWQRISTLAAAHQAGRLSADGFRTAVSTYIDDAAQRADEQAVVCTTSAARIIGRKRQ